MNENQIPSEVYFVLESLNAAGFASFLVGGCVRDLLLGKVPKDFDICTGARPAEVKKLFSEVIDTGIQYGTVTVLCDRLAIEVTTFRKSMECIGDGSRTNKIEFGQTAAEDVQKRDFTINGLLFDGEKVTDYVDGLSDLDQKIIRAIGDPDERIREDSLRMMRAIRFVCQLGFAIEPLTQAAICNNASLISRVSPERIRDELIQILLCNCPSKGFYLLHETGLLIFILPELEKCFNFNQRNPHHSQDVFGHIMTVLENTPLDLTIRLAALLHDIGKPLTFSLGEDGVGHFYGHNLKSCDLAKAVLTRLKFDNKTIDKVLILIKEHMNRLKSPGKSTLKRLINRAGIGNVEALLDLQIADVDRPGKKDEVKDLQDIKQQISTILWENGPMKVSDLAINGDDLISLGIAPGEAMGKILNELLDLVIEKPESNTREDLLKKVQEAYFGLL